MGVDGEKMDGPETKEITRVSIVSRFSQLSRTRTCRVISEVPGLSDPNLDFHAELLRRETPAPGD
jgi:hypothetical protein